MRLLLLRASQDINHRNSTTEYSLTLLQINLDSIQLPQVDNDALLVDLEPARPPMRASLRDERDGILGCPLDL
jgi:hypothetical protein